jgi:PAS domain S-box-containing protein
MERPRILIIDDDPSLRKTLADILRIKGYETLAARDGSEGLALLRENVVNLVLIDLGLPDISGLDVLARVRTEHPSTEAIILTGNATLDSAIEATNRGAFSYLIKPYEMEQLLLLVRRAVEKQQAINELKSVTDSLWMIFNSAYDAIFIHELDGNIIDVNDKMLEMYGINRDEVTRYSIRDDYSAPDNPTDQLPCKWHDAMSGKSQFFEWKAQRPKDGTAFDAEVFLRKITFRKKDVIMATVRDISERKQADTNIKKMQSQIIQQEKLASLGQLAAGVAHEINNPIGFISSNLRSLAKYVERYVQFISLVDSVVQHVCPDESRKEIDEGRRRLKIDHVSRDIHQLIEESIDGTKRVTKIVQDLKSFARIDGAERTHVDINECLDSNINVAWNEIKYVATLNKEYGELPPLLCYPQQLNQVFMNLLINAAQAMDKMGEISIKTWSDGDNVFVAISDTGKGIPPVVMGRIFDPFFTTKEVGKGTGLGLSISYDIIKKHNGEIAVQSEAGKGTCFTLKLPVEKGEG